MRPNLLVKKLCGIILQVVALVCGVEAMGQWMNWDNSQLTETLPRVEHSRCQEHCWGLP